MGCTLERTSRRNPKCTHVPETIPRNPGTNNHDKGTVSFFPKVGPLPVNKALLSPKMCSNSEAQWWHLLQLCLRSICDQRTCHMAVAQKTGTKIGCPGKWKHGPRPAVCPSCLISSHSHILCLPTRSRVNAPSTPSTPSASPSAGAAPAAWAGAAWGLNGTHRDTIVKEETAHFGGGA